MNKEIIKAMNKKEKKHPFRKWWNKNGYKVLRVILFPLWIASIIHEKSVKWLNTRQAWSEERANEILSYYVPRKAEWDEEEKCFCFFDNGFGWNIHLAKRYLKRKDRRFWKNYHHKIRHYLIDSFELVGFVKEEGCCAEGWTELCFTLLENK